ncbi:ribosome-inactivating protein charybdin-like [Diospyros lotus]|uniref:ribosome-inactivating protein charybdin-like n=1 Tax=Diospyros lotus TaxID=55363 RepID=UPI0022596A1E|nr:ribosome-inactivating protein charybdin-like [Diospyros lotus]
MAEFLETFIVKKESTTDWLTYRQFIETTMRQHRELIFRYSHGRPVLHPEVNPPTQWFDIILQNSSNKVRLRIRLDNLYLVGYQMENGKWLEFGLTNPKAPHQIPNSTFLGFKDDYQSMDNAASKDQNRENIKLGWKSLEEAVSRLATSDDGEKRAWSLIVVSQMIPESMRFRSISKQLATKFQDDSAKDNKAEPPPEWMRKQMNNWGPISRELLHIDSDPNHRFQLPSDAEGSRIKTVEDAVAAIGMIKYYKF